MCRSQFPRSSNGKLIGGFSLPIVMIMMLVLAILVLAATQTYNTESRISSNDADKKLAMQLAEAALREGESYIIDGGLNESGQSTKFTDNCDQGLCSVGTTPAWERNCGSGNCLEEKGRKYQTNAVRKSPRYIIEWISISKDSIIFRVTARAWGINKNTMVTIQSYVEADI